MCGDPVKCLVVVAHPDDEVIWMGGLVLRHPNWQWYVLCLCRSGDADREPRFRLAARALGVREHISDLDDSPVLAPLTPHLDEIKTRILALAVTDAALVFTHGPGGEYGHPRHVQTSRAISQMVTAGQISGQLVHFAYEQGDGAGWPRPSPDAAVRVRLTPGECAAKQHIIRDIYGFSPGTFEFESAGSVEAFSVPASGPLPKVRRILSSADRR